MQLYLQKPKPQAEYSFRGFNGAMTGFVEINN